MGAAPRIGTGWKDPEYPSPYLEKGWPGEPPSQELLQWIFCERRTLSNLSWVKSLRFKVVAVVVLIPASFIYPKHHLNTLETGHR